jgi:1-phosphofructokinase family hexose kinase
VTLNPALDRTLTVPHIAFDKMVRASDVRLDWGGKGFNVSRALKVLGVDSVALGFVGGMTGEALARGLAELGIDTDLSPIAGETRTNTVVVEARTRRYVKVNEVGPTVQAAELAAFFDRVRERARRGDVWVLSGSLPPAVQPGFYAQLIDLLRGVGAVALLDASGDPLRLGLAARPFLVKPNAVEAQEATGRDVKTEADAFVAAEAFLQRGVELVALSLGADGLLLASQGRAVRARPPGLRARNPVGAGDALLAGIAWALEQGFDLTEVARWGAACGTAAAVCEGVGVGTLAEIRQLYDRVEVE